MEDKQEAATVETKPAPQPTQSAKKKKQPQDFVFGKILGEGSYSTVQLAREINTGKEFAMKILEKRHIIREKKVPYVSREKEVLSRLSHPFFVQLFFTFQDKERLYYGLSLAKKGELLPYINKLGSFDLKCTQFYSGEIIAALEHLHGLGIIHRDLKPENILLSEDMHIKITDFGTAKILGSPDQSGQAGRNSFVGTAQYVSPELLTDKKACKSSDLWALGCIIYQLLSGLPPFRASNEYQVFQRIIKLEYEFPNGFPECPKALVERLLVLDPTKRLGCDEMEGYPPLKADPFYEGIDWENLSKETPPRLLPYLPATCADGPEFWGDSEINSLHSTDSDIDVGILENLGIVEEDMPVPVVCQENTMLSEQERQERLRKQEDESPWSGFVGNNLILKTGLIDKRKGLFARRRQLILTEGPHLYYVDPQAMVLKGEIPWTKDLKVEAKNFRIFFIHTVR
ncbi:3-phosphoinositide-dependent kinase 1 [Paramuricea clavata]|uniref:3-phosphoinositide-dependent protein kinase 1 n=1 Tax=Paramuricea clavata TaxID=317549 RepID=A0A6S7HER7_PARCT|nr:3-phosphoinositide-dependent kinase 1 [Paramuricea clavata]